MDLTVEHHEMKGYPIEEDREDGFFATRQMWCYWGQRRQLIQQLGADGGHLYPYDPGMGARAIRASCKPFGGQRQLTAGGATYPKAIVTVHYSNSVSLAQTAGGVYIAERLEPNCEYQTISPRGFCWKSGDGTPLDEDEDLALLIRGFDYIVTYYRCSGIPQNIVAYYNACNANPMTTYSLGMVLPAESVLFPGPTAHRTIQLGSSNHWQLTYRYAVRGVGWNKKWCSETQSFEYIYPKGGSSPVRWHPLANFAGLVP